MKYKKRDDCRVIGEKGGFTVKSIGKTILTVEVRFKIKISLLDAIKMRFMGAKNADRIVKYILNIIEKEHANQVR